MSVDEAEQTESVTPIAARMRRLARRSSGDVDRWMLVTGAILAPLGLALIVLGWVGAARTHLLFEQNAYLISGGVLGLGWSSSAASSTSPTGTPSRSATRAARTGRSRQPVAYRGCRWLAAPPAPRRHAQKRCASANGGKAQAGRHRQRLAVPPAGLLGRRRQGGLRSVSGTRRALKPCRHLRPARRVRLVVGTYAISGSASGIGAATRARLEADGHRVIGVDIGDAEVVADLGTPAGRDAAVDEVTARAMACSTAWSRARASARSPTGRARCSSRSTTSARSRCSTGCGPLLARGADPTVVAISSNSTTVAPGWPMPWPRPACPATRTARASSADDAGGSCTYAACKAAVAYWVRRNATQPEWIGAGIRLNARRARA